MTNNIQELKNSLFSHYLLQDHDENSKNSKGVVHSSSKFILDGGNILGQRHPLYLKSLVDCLELPTELNQEEALEMLSPTIEFAKKRLNLKHSHMAIMHSSHDSDFWRSWDYSPEITETFRVPLTLNTSILFSNLEITNPSTHIPSLSIVYQNHVTKLFKEQGFLDEGGRVHTLSNLIGEKAQKLGLNSNGLIVELNNDNELGDNFFYAYKDQKPVLIFPITITNAQVDLIFEKLQKVL